MHRNDLENVILRPGELHIVMAVLRTIGSYIENSGIDNSFVEAGLYSSQTVCQILEGKHVRRGLQTHLTAVQVLYKLYFDAFATKFPIARDRLVQTATQLHQACSEQDTIAVKSLHSELMDSLLCDEILCKQLEFEASLSANPTAYAILQYMQMVVELCAFIRSVRTGNWKLHLSSLDDLTKYFFAHDKQNYARAIPIYLAEMAELYVTAPEILSEFEAGNWVVNKNAVPFCSVGGDHALEHINRSIKVSGGITGITLNENARTRFFLIAPEMARLAREAYELADVQRVDKMQRHEQRHALMQKLHRNTEQLLSFFSESPNPFKDNSEQLLNLVTKSVMHEEIANDVHHRNEIGQQRYTEFVENRIKTNKVNVWNPIPQSKLKMWKESGKKVKIKFKESIVELKECNSLLIRLLVVARSRPGIDLKQSIGLYEFSVVPRALFAADGSLHHCVSKSALMHILEKQEKTSEENSECTFEVNPTSYSVAIIDGMAELQGFQKEKQIQTCEHLANSFLESIEKKYQLYHEVHLVFDRYDVPMSLKTATRDIRTSKVGSLPVAYKIDQRTNIGHISMAKLLAHTQTKHELTVFLSNKFIEQSMFKERQSVAAYSNTVKATKFSVDDLASSQEEADTKLIFMRVMLLEEKLPQLTFFHPIQMYLYWQFIIIRTYVQTQISSPERVLIQDRYQLEKSITTLVI